MEMLVKCVCSNCGHSYLADEDGGVLTCPRCGVEDTTPREPAGMGDAGGSYMDEPAGQSMHGGPTLSSQVGGSMVGGGMPPPMDDYGDPAVDDYGMEPGMDPGAVPDGVYDHPDDGGFGFGSFDPQAPPPMIVTWERLFKGLIFGSLAATATGLVIGGAMSAIQVAVPLVGAALVAMVAGAATRYGFGGRTASNTTGRVLFCIVIVVVLANAGLVAGAWAVDRFTGAVDRDADGVPDIEQTRAELKEGLRTLSRERARNADTGTGMVIEQDIAATEKLRQLSDPQLEDYLWVQQAQINQPLLAYGKLRVTDGAAIRVPKVKAINLPQPAPLVIVLVELAAAVFIAMRGVTPRR